MVDGLMGNLMDSIRNMAISTLGMNYGNSNKRLKSTNTDDLSQNPLSKVIKSVAPSISYFFNQKKMVQSIKFDEQRNIMYVLQQQLKNGQSIIEVYDLGSIGDQFAKVATITQKSFVRHLIDY